VVVILVVGGAQAPLPSFVSLDPDVAVIVPADLAQSGWRLSDGLPPPTLPPSFPPAMALTGILCRLVRVTEADLPSIHLDEREYVASEMTAFLAAFLSQLEARTLNEPNPANLAGPPFSQERWLRLASDLGLDVCRQCQGASDEMVCIGSQVLCVDGSSPRYQRRDAIRALSISTRVSHFGVAFCSEHPSSITAVSCQPSLTVEVWRALRQHLGGR